MTLRRIGERTVFPIGLLPRPPAVDELVQPRDELFDTVSAGLDAGVTLLDVGPLDSGSSGVLGIVVEAIAAWNAPEARRQRVVVAGHVPLGDDTDDADRLAGRGAEAAEQAAQQLGRPLGLCFLRPSAGTRNGSVLLAVLEHLADCDAIEALGVADVDRHLVRQLLGENPDAPLAAPAVAVQNQFGSGFAGVADLIERCAAGRLAYLPRVPVKVSEEAHEPHSPFESFKAIAQQRSQSVLQLTLAWLLARADAVVPVVACAHAAEIEAAVHAADIELTGDELAQLSAAIPRSLTVFDEAPSA